MLQDICKQARMFCQCFAIVLPTRPHSLDFKTCTRDSAFESKTFVFKIFLFKTINFKNNSTCELESLNFLFQSILMYYI